MRTQQLTDFVLIAAVVSLGIVGVLGWRSLSAQDAVTQQQLAQFTQTLAEVNEVATRAPQSMAALESGLGKTDARVEGIAQDVGALKADVASAKSSLATISDDVGQVRTGLSIVGSDVTQLNTSLAQASQIASTLRSDLAAASAKLDQTSTQTQSIVKDVATLQGNAATMGADLASLNAELLRLQQAVAQQSSQSASLGALVTSTGTPSTRLSVTGTVSLTVNPSSPFAGQDTDFTLQGLDPWQRVTIAMLQPDGAAAQWVTESEAYVADSRGNRVTQRTLHADASGQLQWRRVAAQDGEGTWRVQLILNGATHTMPYQVSQLQLATERIQRFGLDLRRYQGLAADVYFSSGVSTALVLDLQAHLFAVRSSLSERLGLRSVLIPNLYVFNSQELFSAAGRAIGVTVTSEAGFFTNQQPFDGIYIRADSFPGELRETLTHEYVHLLLDEWAPGLFWPTWVNEGLATYEEHAIALSSERAAATKPRIYTRVDRVRQSLAAEVLPPLATLESQVAWNAKQDSALQGLQYAQAYLAIRYLVERHGEAALVTLLGRLAERQPIHQAIQSATGQTYPAFDQAFREWLRNFADPDHETARAYDTAASGYFTEWDRLMDQRRANLSSPSTAFADLLVASATSFRQRVLVFTPPEGWSALQQGLVTFADCAVAWLTFEQESVRTSDDATLAQANDMVPEMNARGNTLRQRLNELAFQYQLQ